MSIKIFGKTYFLLIRTKRGKIRKNKGGMPVLKEKIFFERINTEIIRQYKTMKAFAEATGIPQTTLHTILHKSRLNASFDTVIRICDALDIDIDPFREDPVSETEQRALCERYQAFPDMRPAVRKLLEIEPRD